MDDDEVTEEDYRGKVCVHMMPPEWCATCIERRRKLDQEKGDRELFNLFNSGKWSL